MAEMRRLVRDYSLDPVCKKRLRHTLPGLDTGRAHYEGLRDKRLAAFGEV